MHIGSKEVPIPGSSKTGIRCMNVFGDGVSTEGKAVKTQKSTAPNVEGFLFHHGISLSPEQGRLASWDLYIHPQDLDNTNSLQKASNLVCDGSAR